MKPRSYGRYQALAKLGIGGTGVVFLARDRSSGELVALKAPFRQLAADPVRRARFRRECVLLRELAHPHLVRALAADAEAEAPWLAMDYLRGEPLSDRLAAGPLELMEAMDLLEDLAGVLAHLHRQNVLHRDLKPSNLFLEDSGRTLLLDLGVAAATPDCEAIAGTFLYAAPEQNRGESVEAGADLWSFGAVAFEVLTGSRALSATTLPAAVHEQSTDAVPDPREFAPLVPSRLADIVLAATRTAPEARPGSAREVHQTLVDLRQQLEASRPEVFELHGDRRRVRALLASADLEGASKLLESLEERYPEDSWHPWMAAVTSRRRRCFAPALACLERAAGVGLDRRELLLEQGRIQLAAGDPEGLADCLEALGEDPDPLAMALRASLEDPA